MPTSSSGARRWKPGQSFTTAFLAAPPTMSLPAFPACSWASRSSKPMTRRAPRALADYYRYARDNELYLTYVIINPQADRSKPAGEQQDRFLTAGVVDQDAARPDHPRRQDAGDGRHHGERGVRHLHPAVARGRRALCSVLRRADECRRAEDPVAQILRGERCQRLRQSARQPLRRERRRALLRRCESSLGARLHQPGHRHVPAAVPCHAGACLPELPGADPPDGEDALPRRHRPAHRRDQRRHRTFRRCARRWERLRRRTPWSTRWCTPWR